MVKTKVKRNTLNPVWNEELMLPVPDPLRPLKLFVFDKDFFTADDEMGDAEIDLRPLVAAAKLNAEVDFQEGSNIGRVLRTSSNHFVKDSFIKFKDASLVQEICIKLQNVQKGHIELEVRWRPRIA
ncbi:hypothetical protein KP509_20G090600 [Ceratopteris richardii]|nr:hypothetical protein KP509_20G090600 [Ceratopteris richardii]